MKLHSKITNPRTIKSFSNLENIFNEIHNFKYRYDKAIYIGTHEKIVIICHSHGEFKQSPATHKKGVGCPKCGKKNSAETNLIKSQKAKESFIERAEKIHSFKYNYSKSIYHRTHDKVIIICPEHGSFEQSPAKHLSGRGCPKCGFESTQKENDRRAKLAADKFIKNAVGTHGKRYNYQGSEYKTSKTKITIICPLHGGFKQTPSHHLEGNGCPKCGRISTAKKLNEAGANKFIKTARKIHNDKYIYSKVIYTEYNRLVEIICPNHGIFKQTPAGHLTGKGCAKCGREKVNLAQKKRTEKARIEFRDNANKVHNFKYDYSLVKYTTSSEKITIKCPDHSEFNQTPNSHLRSGCPSCAKTGFSSDKPGLLYYLKVSGGIAFKIGITNRTVEERFSSDMSKIDILKTWYFEDGSEARQKEKEILNEFKYAKWMGVNLLIDGNSELFSFDILGLDNYEKK